MPRQLRNHFARAYLFARAGDTVADTQAVPSQERDHWLSQLEEAAAQLAQGESITLEAPPLGPGGGHYERGLMVQLPRVANWVSELEVPARKRAGWVCGTLFGAMRKDLAYFGLRPKEIIALPNEEALADYLYGNAGCVGAYWAQELGATSAHLTATELAGLEQAGIQLGNALQRVNVLRDLASDLHRGRCYLPADAVTACGLQPQELVSPAAAWQLKPLLKQQIAAARRDLANGVGFFSLLPYHWVRSRVAAALPAILARRTLDRVEAQPSRLLDPGDTVKVPRPEVKRLIARLLLIPPSNRGLNRMVIGRPIPWSLGSESGGPQRDHRIGPSN